MIEFTENEIALLKSDIPIAEAVTAALMRSWHLLTPEEQGVFLCAWRKK